MLPTATRASSLSCRINNYGGWQIFGTISTCLSMGSIVLDSESLSIEESYGKNIKGLWISSNDQVKYLPVRVAKSFPSLIAYWVDPCPIKQISYKNFADLYALEEFYMRQSQITQIDNDTFKDLTSLKKLYLGLIKDKKTFWRKIWKKNHLFFSYRL